MSSTCPGCGKQAAYHWQSCWINPFIFIYFQLPEHIQWIKAGLTQPAVGKVSEFSEGKHIHALLTDSGDFTLKRIGGVIP